MVNESINPDSLFPSRQFGFSQIVVAAGSRTVFLSGQVAWDAKQEVVGPGDLKQQAWHSLRNVETALSAAGATLQDVVALRIYIVQEQMENGAAISEALQAFFPGEQPPTATWIGVHSLANPDFLIEIEATAVLA